MAITLNTRAAEDLPNPRPGKVTLYYNENAEPRVRIADGTDLLFKGERGETGPQGEQGQQGPQGVAGADGIDGVDGDDGYTLELANVVDGERRVQQVVALIGTDGTRLETDPPGYFVIGRYIGPLGLVNTPGEATDVRGAKGDTGATGAKGDTGDTGAAGADGLDGYTLEIANVFDGARVVQQVVSLIDSDGNEITVNPPGYMVIGRYIGPAGFTANIAEATDIRGAAGANGVGGGGSNKVYDANTVAYSSNQTAPGNFTEVGDLTYMLEPNSVYEFSIDLGWQINATGGPRFQLSAPAGSKLLASGVVQSANSVGNVSAVNNGSPSADGLNIFRVYGTTNGATNSPHHAGFTGVVSTGPTAGNLVLSFGSSATTATVSIPIDYASRVIEKIV